MAPVPSLTMAGVPVPRRVALFSFEVISPLRVSGPSHLGTGDDAQSQRYKRQVAHSPTPGTVPRSSR